MSSPWIVKTMTVSQLQQAYQDKKALYDRLMEHRRVEWIGATPEQIRRMLLSGVGPVPPALADVERSLLVDRLPTTSERKRVVNGGAISVPRALKGNPRCFTRRKPAKRRGIRVYQGIGGLNRVEPEGYTRYMTTVLGAVRVAASVRPVEFAFIRAVCTNRNHLVITIPVGVRPINWKLVGALAHIGVFRGFFLPLSQLLLSGRWARLETYPIRDVDLLREKLNATPQDVILPAPKPVTDYRQLAEQTLDAMIGGTA